jgi:hypothetical protein
MKRRDFLKSTLAIIPLVTLSQAFAEEGQNFYFANILQVDKANGNNRIYTRKCIEKVVDNFNPIFGEFLLTNEMNYKENCAVISFANVSHSIEELFFHGDFLIAKIKILDTPRGKLLKSSMKEICFRPRGTGKIETQENGIQTITEYSLISVDAIFEKEAAKI